MHKEIIDKLKEGGLYRSLVLQESGQFPEIVIDGKKVLSFSSNNYLGLSYHPAVLEAGRKTIEQYGGGSGASRLLGGDLIPHRDLEREIAGFKGTESALLFGSGYLANLAIVTALTGENDLILADRLNHASLVDACRLSRGKFRIYPHGEMDQLERLLSKKKKGEKTFIITEGVFSMDGDMAPLPDIIRLAGKYDAMLILDDAHGFGVIGPNGRGTAEFFGVEKEIPVQMGTLGKAAGVSGAFVAGSKSLVEVLINRARPFIYSTAPPPVVAGMGLASLKIMTKEQKWNRRLSENISYFKERMTLAGFSVPAYPTPIIPLVTGDLSRTVALSKWLFEEGLYLPAIRPPTVPEGTCRLRISLSAAHTREHLNLAVKILLEGGKRFGLL